MPTPSSELGKPDVTERISIPGKAVAEDLVVRLLDLEDLGNRLEQEARLEVLQFGRQTLAVVREPDDVPHDPRRAVAAEGLRPVRGIAGRCRRARRGSRAPTTRTPNGSSREPSCMVLPAPTMPLAPEITSEPRWAGGPNTWSTRSAVRAGRAPRGRCRSRCRARGSRAWAGEGCSSWSPRGSIAGSCWPWSGLLPRPGTARRCPRRPPRSRTGAT